MAENAQDAGWPQTANPSVYSQPSAPTSAYFESLKESNPAAYAKIADLAKFTANENFGGNVQDYQAQLFTPLGSDVIKGTKSLDLSSGVPDGVQAVTEEVASGQMDNPTYSTNLTGYSKDLGVVNGVPVTAVYDADGKLTGYQGDSRVRSFLDGSHSVSGAWDASGKPVPQQYSSQSGGFLGEVTGGISDLVKGIGDGISDAYMQVRDPLEAAAVVAGNYFLPGSGLVTSQLVSDKAKESLNSDLGRVAMIGSGIAGGVDGNLSNYGFSEPSPTYDYGEPNPTYDYGEPNPTYDYGEPNPTYDYGEPNPTYDYSEPNPTYDYSEPNPTYDYGEPSPTYDYSEPSPTYDYSEPPPEVPSTPDLAETPAVPEMPDEVPSGPDLPEPPPEAPTVPTPMPEPSGLEQLATLAAANPILTAGGIATLVGGAVGGTPTTQTPATPASTPQTYKINPFDFQRNYNTPTDTLTSNYSRGQNTGERNWVTDTLTALPQQTVPAKASGGSISSHEAYMHPQYIAQQLAAQGRGGDDTLVHMNRNEVAGLQSLAQAHGKSLHINPRTGMPEAFNLGQELGNATKGIGAPLIGAGISAFTGLDPITAAAMVGGTQAVVSGNLGQGLMAGLGAYGGASLMGGLGAMGGAVTPESARASTLLNGGTEAAAAENAAAAPGITFDNLKSGASYAANNPQAALAELGNGSAWKGAGVLGAAASPILADMMVKTTTGAPTNQNPAMIRPYTFQHNAVAPQNMVQPSYQQGQSTAERRWFDDNLTPHTPYLASQANTKYADGGFVPGMASGGLGSLGGYSDGGQLLKGPGDGVSDSIPATIGHGQQPARLANNEFVVPARIVSELGNGSTDAGAKQLYKMMDRIQAGRKKTMGKNSIAVDSKAVKHLPA